MRKVSTHQPKGTRKLTPRGRGAEPSKTGRRFSTRATVAPAVLSASDAPRVPEELRAVTTTVLNECGTDAAPGSATAGDDGLDARPERRRKHTPLDAAPFSFFFLAFFFLTAPACVDGVTRSQTATGRPDPGEASEVPPRQKRTNGICPPGRT